VVPLIFDGFGIIAIFSNLSVVTALGMDSVVRDTKLKEQITAVLEDPVYRVKQIFAVIGQACTVIPRTAEVDIENVSDSELL
jgi:hypothetical protein